MCGILYTSHNLSRERFMKALGRMRHRGPDGEPGYLERGSVKLGHNRLKVIDLDDRAAQPFFSRDGRYALIYNGEVYNHGDLARKHGIARKTSSDTEVIVELFRLLGPEMLKELNGMFSMVILDTDTGAVFAARDRLGVKPLYYAQSGNGIVLASEIAPVIELTGKSVFDEFGLRQYRKLRAFFNGRTAYKGIEMFPAGHYMLNGVMKKYWDIPAGPQSPPGNEELLDLLKSAVEMRCVSDVPAGAYLSGGLDSTLVAALSGLKNTWTVGFEEMNEFEWARLASLALESDHAEVLIDQEDFAEMARGLIRERMEPLSVPNEVLLYAMTREVKKKNTVVLSGEGADELFFGYDRIFRWAAGNHWDLREFSRLYSYGTIDDLDIVEDAVSPFLCRGKAIDIVAAFFQSAHLHGLLRRLDSSTMLCSVEARAPFVDYRLIERMAGVPFEYRIEDNVPKAQLKRIARGIVPDEIILRKKVGFPVPLGSMSFNSAKAATPMDAWLEFNLMELTGAKDSERGMVAL